nr:transporter [Burkholderia sp. NRF60-BP8]
MNKTYRNIWNAATGTWTAVAETAKSHSKGSARAARQAVVALALGGAVVGGAYAADACSTEDDRSGWVDATGACVLASTTGGMSRSSAITSNPLNDALIKVNAGNANTEATASNTGSIAIGGGAMATASGSNGPTGGGIAIGQTASASHSSVSVGTNAFADSVAGRATAAAFGTASYANGAGATALGANASASGSQVLAVGSMASARADNGTAVGYGASIGAQGANSVALGNGSTASDANVVSIGTAAAGGQRRIVNMAAGTQDTDAVNLGQMNAALAPKIDDTYVKINPSTATAAVATGGAMAIGGNAQATLGGATAIGNDAVATARNTTSLGFYTSASGGAATAIGAYAEATAEHAIALGVAASAGHAESVAIGVSSTTDRDNSVSVGSGKLQRQITNMAAGTKATDAVNVSQLTPVVNALGGGAAIDPTTGAVTGPTYTLVNGGTQTTVGGALGALDGELTVAKGNIAQNTTDITNINNQLGDLASGTIGIVQQAGAGADITVGASTDGTTVNFTGTAGDRKLAGVAAGDVSATSNEAINGSQLHGVSQSVADAIGAGSQVNPDGSITAPSFTVGDGNGGTTTVHTVGDAVTNLDGRVTINEGDIKNLADQIGNGTVGLVQQDATTRDITVAQHTDGKVVDFTGTDGARKLIGVDAGEVSATSNEAINGSQLHGVSQSVASAIGAGSQVNPDGSISAPSFTVGDGNGGTTTVHNVGDAVTNLDGRVTNNEGAITNINQQLAAGQIGLVQQDPTTGAITVGATTGGSSISFAGTGGARTLSGVANGVNDDDAVTIAQLKATGLIDYTGKEIAAVTYDDITLGSVTFGGSGGTALHNVAPGLIASGSMDAVNGGQLYDLQQQFAQQYAAMDGRVGALEQNPGNGGGSGGPGNGMGPGNGTGGDGSLVVGTGSNAAGSNSSAVGQGAVATGDNGSAFGQGSVASGENSTAIGQGSNASGNGSVALGQGSVADRDNAVSVGSAGNERQITNVAAGTAPTDAVNVQQLNDNINSVRSQIDSNRRDSNGGTASAVAIANLPQASLPGESMVSVAGGTYGGESATAFGISTATRNGKWVVKASGSTNTRGTVAVGAGVGYRW